MLFYSYDLEKDNTCQSSLPGCGEGCGHRLAVQFWKVLKKLGGGDMGLMSGLSVYFCNFWYDLSDRELGGEVREDDGFRWFCGFSLEDETPDRAYFTDEFAHYWESKVE